ncbi:MAG: hypothetical protein M0Z53_03310 [Thermaerobacter sp.]|nr:hypothetical protein [Thermaerobacter sp.]
MNNFGRADLRNLGKNYPKISHQTHFSLSLTDLLQVRGGLRLRGKLSILGRMVNLMMAFLALIADGGLCVGQNALKIRAIPPIVLIREETAPWVLKLSSLYTQQMLPRILAFSSMSQARPHADL